MPLAAYFIAIAAVSFFSGKLSTVVTITHNRTQMLISFISGFIIGMAVSHLLPHSLSYISGPDAFEETSTWLLFGIIFMVLLLRAFNFQQYEFGDSHNHKTSLWGLVIGLGLHSITEGIALGISIRVAPDSGEEILKGLGIFLVIILHKPLDACSIIGMMRSSGFGRRACSLANILFALLCPLVMVLTYFSMQYFTPFDSKQIAGYVLAFTCGLFLCIALNDLLPEVQFHRHDRKKLTMIFLLGIFISYSLNYLEH